MTGIEILVGICLGFAAFIFLILLGIPLGEDVTKIKPNGYKVAYTKKELKDRQSKGYTMPLDTF